MARIIEWLRWHLATRMEASTRGDGIGAGREFAQRAAEKRERLTQERAERARST